MGFKGTCMQTIKHLLRVYCFIFYCICPHFRVNSRPDLLLINH